MGSVGNLTEVERQELSHLVEIVEVLLLPDVAKEEVFEGVLADGMLNGHQLDMPSHQHQLARKMDIMHAAHLGVEPREIQVVSVEMELHDVSLLPQLEDHRKGGLSIAAEEQFAAVSDLVGRDFERNVPVEAPSEEAELPIEDPHLFSCYVHICAVERFIVEFVERMELRKPHCSA